MEKEGHIGFTGNCAGQQGFASSRMADQENTLRDPSAEAAIGLRIAQKVDNFLQLALGFVDPGHIRESGLNAAFDIDLGLGFAHGHHAAKPLLFGEAADEERPQSEQQQHRHDPRQQVAQECRLDYASKFDVVLSELLGERNIDLGGDEIFFSVDGLAELALDRIFLDRDLFDLAVFEILLELAVRDWLDGLVSFPPALEQEQGHDSGERVPEINLMLFFPS